MLICCMHDITCICLVHLNERQCSSFMKEGKVLIQNWMLLEKNLKNQVYIILIVPVELS